MPLLTLLTLLPAAQAAPRATLLACLGREELKIHRSGSEGPLYRLNRVFVNKLTGIGEFPVDAGTLRRICDAKDFSPSVALLRELLITPGTGSPPGWKRLATHAPGIFFDYASGLQSLAPSAWCLAKKVPHLARLQERHKHLQAEYSWKTLAREADRIKDIFDKFKDLDALFESCRGTPAKGASGS